MESQNSVRLRMSPENPHGFQALPDLGGGFTIADGDPDQVRLMPGDLLRGDHRNIFPEGMLQGGIAVSEGQQTGIRRKPVFYCAASLAAAPDDHVHSVFFSVLSAKSGFFICKSL